MTSYLLRRKVVITTTCLTLQFMHLQVSASQIRYSWSGRIVPASSDDPWHVGEEGGPFKLDVTVSRNIPDLSDANVEIAAFEVEDARLILDGFEVNYLGNGIIDFTDDHEGLYDIIVFVGIFERFGSAIEIGTSVALPLDTFRFSQLRERPPVFQPALNAAQFSMGPQGPYVGIVTSGTPVSVVSEPASIIMLAASSSLIMAVRIAPRVPLRLRRILCRCRST